MAFFNKKTYVISFDSKGGSLVDDIKVKKGNIPIKPDYPIKEGYVFVSWQLNGEDYHFDKSLNKNIHLVAKWIKAEYYIRVGKVDDYSPDRYLTIYKGQEQIKVKKIKYIDNVSLISSIQNDKIVVANADIIDEISLKIILEDDREKIALLVK